MTARRFLSLVVVSCVLVVAPRAWAGAPPDVSYQGRLLRPDGQPVAGPVNMQILIYESPTPVPGETALYLEDHEGVLLDGGVFDLLLGQGTPLIGIFDAELFSGPDRWLEVRVNGERLEPRQPISSVPFAFQASNAGRLAGKEVPEIGPPTVFDGEGNELGPLVSVQQDFTTNFCMGGMEEPAGRQVTFFHRPSGSLFSSCLLNGEQVSASSMSGLAFTGPNCTGEVYGSGEIAGFAVTFRGHVYTAKDSPTPGPIQVQSTGSPAQPGFEETCYEAGFEVINWIRMRDVTDRVEFSYPLPAPLSIEAGAPSAP